MDRGTFYETQEAFAQNIVTGFARLGGHSIGIIANQPAFLAGVLDINSSEKAGRFVRFCDLAICNGDLCDSAILRF